MNWTNQGPAVDDCDLEEYYVSVHQHIIEDEQGDAVDALYFCSDFCHRSHMGEEYQGWNGCVEVMGPAYCEECNAEIGD